jgi:hypothetical protein
MRIACRLIICILLTTLFNFFSAGFLLRAAPLDSLLGKTYGEMHSDCLSDTYVDDKLIKAMFVEMDTLKVMDLLKDRDMSGFAAKYIDPELIKSKKEKLKKRYNKLNSYLDLKGRGFTFEDMSNGYLAMGLLLYRYVHYGITGYGLILDKKWTSINSKAWKLTFKLGQDDKEFYFRRVETRWYLTDKQYIE